jgi:hypothetical protein
VKPIIALSRCAGRLADFCDKAATVASDLGIVVMGGEDQAQSAPEDARDPPLAGAGVRLGERYAVQLAL